MKSKSPWKKCKPWLAPVNKVEITIQAGKLHEQWRAVELALIKTRCPVFVRGGKLVWPQWRWEKEDTYDASNNREVLTLRITVYSNLQLQDMVAHHAATFNKEDRRRKRLVDVDPPAKLIEALRGAGHWRFPTLRGVIAAPTLRPDGSLLNTQGYDRQTALWFKPDGNLVLPPIPEQPTKAQAKAELAKLKELLTEFPFADPQSLAAALAAIMTAALRGAFLAAPIILVTAPEPRSGKTYLIQLIGVTATGHHPVNTAGSENPEEMEKRIEAAGLSGRSILHLNNLPNGMVLRSVALAQMATEGVFVVRKLGGYDEGEIDCKATTVMVNGNNVNVAADLVDRTMLCRINAMVTDPGLRTFKNDPIKRVLKARGEYLAACFIIARAYLAAGAPKIEAMRVVAGFEGWTRFVQAPLMWLGCEDPLGNQTMARSLDVDRDQLRELLKAVRTVFNDQVTTFTVASLGKLAEETRQDPSGRSVFRYPVLHEMMSAYGRINPEVFGRTLKRHLDRIDDGWMIRLAPSGVRVKAYQLFKVDGPEPKPIDPDDEPM